MQASPHGSPAARSGLHDVLRRWMMARGYDVTVCRNVDIDDKILLKAAQEQRPWWAVAQHYERNSATPTRSLAACRQQVEPAPPATFRR